MRIRYILIPVLSLAFCLAVIWEWTLGYKAFTIFSYTLNAAGPLPRPLPEVSFIDQDSSIFRMEEKQKYLLINFVYLNCPYVCHKVNNQLEQIYHLTDTSMIPSKLEFVTVSFDTEKDDVNKLRRYRSYFGADISGWTFALPYQTDGEKFDRFLKEAGIWKQKVQSTGIINHSIYLLLVSPQHQIIRVFDPARESNHRIVQQIEACLKQNTV